MLDNLRQRIETETRPRRAITPSAATRIVIVALSDRLALLRALQEETFPTHPSDLSIIRPWLAAAKEGFAEELERVVRRALGLDIAAQLGRAGITFRRSSLIVLVGDTSDSGFIDTLGNASAAIQAVTARWQLAGHSFFLTGIFLYDSASEDPAKRNLPSACSELFAKVFLLDTRNPSGLELTEEDRRFQILHVLRYLERFPESCGSDEEFVEWIQSAGPTSGYGASAGGSTVYYPVDAILETACVQAGAMLLGDSLLHVNADDRYQFYTARFKLDAGLVSFGDLESDLARGAPNPFSGVGASTGEPEGDSLLLAALERTNGGLESLAAAHEAALQSTIATRLAEWKHLLEDYVDAIVTSENGGLRLAGVFLDEIGSGFQSMRELAPPCAPGPDPSQFFQQAASAVNGLPTTASLVTHGIAGAAVAGYVSLSGPFSQVGNVAAAIGAPIGILAFAGLWGHAAATKSERRFAELRGALSLRWEYLLNSAVRRVATQLLLTLSDSVTQVRDDVQRKIVRCQEAVDWFAREHAPPVPRSSTIHWPLLQERGELMQAASPLVEIAGLPPSSYLQQQSGRLLWRRFAQPGEATPNAYEWHLLEQAAMFALVRHRHLLDTRILLQLRGDPVRLQQVRDHGRLTAEPFVTMRPGAGEPETLAVLEADATDCEGILRELEADLRPHFTRLSTVRRSSPYLLAVTSIATRIAFQDAAGLEPDPS
jgi:hypothetical protein